MPHEELLHRLGLFHLRPVKIRLLRRIFWQFQRLQIQQQFQYLDLKIGPLDPFRHCVQLPENVFNGVGAMHHVRVNAAAELFLQGPQVHGKVLHFLRQGPAGRIHIKGYHCAVVMGQGHLKMPGVGKPAVKFQIPRLHIGVGVVSRRIFQPPLPAVVDAEEIPVRLEFAVIITDMEIVIGKADSRKNLIDGDSPFPCFIPELVHAASIVFRQFHSVKLEITWRGTFELSNFLHAGIARKQEIIHSHPSFRPFQKYGRRPSP